MGKGRPKGSHEPDGMAWPRVELGGRRYVILPETAYARLVSEARGGARSDWLASDGPSPFAEGDTALGARIAQRRKEAGLTQKDLAGAASIRAETLNRIERGRTTPDFATIRQLVVALNGAVAPARSTTGPRPARRSARRPQ